MHRLGATDEASLGGSCGGYAVTCVQTRSHSEISRLTVNSSGDHPVWDVDAIFSRLQPPGNGPHYFALDDDMHSPDAGDPGAQTTKLERTIIDLRTTVNVDTLDDFYISDRTITITDYIAAPRRFLQIGPTGVTEAHLHSLLTPWPMDIVDMNFGAIPDLHPLAEQFIASSVPFDWDMIENLNIYCDGSTYLCPETEDTHAGMSIIITGTMNVNGRNAYGLLGFTGGAICTDSASPHWWGATAPRSIDAERAGVLLALLWILQSDYAVGLPCTIWFDCTAAGWGASGQWNYPIESVIAELLRGIGQLCAEYCPGLIRYEHTHAHVGDPANELADCAAKAFARGTLPNYTALIDIAWLVDATKTHGSWTWLYFGAFARTADLPTMVGDAVQLPTSTSEARVPPTSSVLHSHTVADTTSLSLTIASANVRSLYTCQGSDKDQRFIPAKAHYLAQQFAWYGYDIIGLQETCTKHTGLSQIGDYIRVIGGCNPRGLLGCELWISRKRFHLQLHDLCVLHHDERRLIARVQTDSLDMTFVTLHSPHTGATADDKTAWWRYTKTICHRLCTTAPTIICIDANAQITSQVDDVTGTLVEGHTSENEHHLIDFCRSCQLMIPATYQDFQRNATGTWWHPTGKWLRIDYVLPPQRWKTSVSDTWTDDNIDLGNTTEDHRPTGCKIELMIEKRQRKCQLGHYDWSRAEESTVQEELSKELTQLPNISWDTNVHDHATQIKDSVHQVLSQVLGPAKKLRKTSYISDATWATRTGKRKMKLQLLAREKYMNHNWTIWAITAWKPQQRLLDVIRPHLCWLLRCERISAYQRRMVLETARELRENLCQDRTNYAQDCAKRCEGQPLHKIFKELRCLRVGGIFRKRAQVPLPLLHHPDGTTASTPSEIDEIWRLHCASLEAGEEITPERLLQSITDDNAHRDIAFINPDDIPTLSRLEHHVRRVQRHKAPGCDQLPSMVCNLFPREISRLLYPLLLKQAITLEEALEFKGGLLIPAYKGKGKTSEVSSYRGLMLTSVFGKTLRAAYRERMLVDYYAYTADGHYSARAQGNVGQAAMSLRLFLRLAKQQKRNCGIIFLDIQHAYYSVCRELASGFTGTDEQLCRLFSFFKLPPETMVELRQLISGGTAMELAGCSRYHCSLLHELGSNTWFKTRRGQVLTRTHGGSRPGDGLADLIFGFIFARMLDNLRKDMQSASIWDSTPWKLDVPRTAVLCNGYIPTQLPSNLEICWADDLALAMTATTAADILDRVQAVGGFLLRWIRKFGMKPNLQRGKSETLLHLRGPGSRKIKLTLHTMEDPALDIILDDEQAVQLRITHQYRHLGGQLHYIGNMLQEVKARCGMATAAFADYRRKVFSNKHLTLKHRGQLLQCMIFSIMRWNYGAWPGLDARAYTRFFATTLNLAKRICYADHRSEEVWSRNTDRILTDVGILSPQESLHVARLGFYTTAIHTAPDCLWVLIAAERTWISQVDLAMQWMWAQLENSVPQNNFVDFMQEWAQQVQLKPRKWRGWVKRAESHAILQRCNAVQVKEWHAKLFDKLSMAGFRLPQLKIDCIPKETGWSFCGPCKHIFGNRTSWAVHCFKTHQRKDPLRPYIHNGECKGCGGDYRTTRRLLAHLRYSKRCAIVHVFHSRAADTVPPGRNSRDEDKDRPLPVPHNPGTERISVTEEMEVHYAKVMSQDTFTPLLCSIVSNATTEALRTPSILADTIRKTIITQIMAAEEMYNILVEMQQALQDRSLYDQAAGIAYVLNNWTAEWIFAEDFNELVYPRGWMSSTSVTSSKAEAIQHACTDAIQAPSSEYVPRIRYKEVLAVRFFSGTRRTGDFQEWVAKIEVPEGMVLTPVSVDIIFDGQLGDLTNSESQAKWLNLAYCGIMIAALLGPPCNTWSVSRWRALTLGDQGPRPVRFLHCYYGAWSLRVREIRQVTFGNSLLFFAFDIVLALGLTKRVAILEHPDVATKMDIPSIWTTNAFKVIAKLPGVRILQIHQGVFGAPSPKPTRLCVTGGISCERHFDKHGTFAMPPPMRMQKEGKHFATAKLKEYPSALAAAMADCVGEWLLRELPHYDPCTAQDLTRESLGLVEPFRVDFCGIHTFGADTRGHNHL